jgi:hypothetical protein
MSRKRQESFLTRSGSDASWLPPRSPIGYIALCAVSAVRPQQRHTAAKSTPVSSETEAFTAIDIVAKRSPVRAQIPATVF